MEDGLLRVCVEPVCLQAAKDFGDQPFVLLVRLGIDKDVVKIDDNSLVE